MHTAGAPARAGSRLAILADGRSVTVVHGGAAAAAATGGSCAPVPGEVAARPAAHCSLAAVTDSPPPPADRACGPRHGPDARPLDTLAAGGVAARKRPRTGAGAGAEGWSGGGGGGAALEPPDMVVWDWAEPLGRAGSWYDPEGPWARGLSDSAASRAASPAWSRAASPASDLRLELAVAWRRVTG